MSRPLFYLALSFQGDAMLVVGAVDHNVAEIVVAVVIALGAWLMLATGWWLRWERTTYSAYEETTSSPFDWEID